MKAIICVGISASGKTTFAKEMEKAGYVDINRDTIRFTAIQPGGSWATYKFNKKNEDRVTEIQKQLIGDAFLTKKSIIISDTNLNPRTRQKWIDFCTDLGYEVEIKEFHIDFDEAVKRDNLRANGVGKDVIYKQWLQWNDYIGRRVYVPNKSLPTAVIFDIDGTLAHAVDRGHYDWEKVGQDTVDQVVRNMCNAYAFNYENIIVLSGRDSICRKETEQWLKTHAIIYDELYMREQGDMRKDAIIKEEIFFNNIADRYNVVAVVDDRPQMIHMWHEIKIPQVVCVGNPYIEF